VVLALGLLGLLFLNTVLAQDAYRAHDLQRSGVVLADQEQALLRQVDALNDAAALAARARALGMVPANEPRFLLPNGRLLGAALPAGQPAPRTTRANAAGLVVIGTPAPAPAPAPSAGPAKSSQKAAAKPATKASAKPSSSGR
jgi:hypothetical protein